MGKLVTSINDVKQNESYYWMYFVDSKLANVAADKYILTRDSEIFWWLMPKDKAFSLV